MKRKKIEKKLRKELDKERYEHTMGVMYTAAALAMAHQSDIEQAMYAGLLHDCAKCIPNEDKLRLCEKYQIPVRDSERRCPFLLHAKLGAYYAEYNYKVNDPMILHAIKVHKNYQMRETSLEGEDLDRAMLQILSDTLAYLREKGGELDTMTLQTYNYYKEFVTQ